MLLNNLSNGTADLSGLDMICAQDIDQARMGVEMLRNLTSGITIGLGMPVCSDNEILDDLIEWGIQELEEFLDAGEPRDVCL